MKTQIRRILAGCLLALLYTQAFAQVDTARRFNQNSDPNPGKILIDTTRIRPNGPDNRSPIRSIPDNKTPQTNPDRIVQPGDTLGRSKNPGKR